MRFPLFFRTVAIAFVAAAILVPLGLVASKVNERKNRAQGVEADFARETSGAQTIVGPLLALECEETVMLERLIKRDGKEDTITEKKVRPCATQYFPPRTLDVTGNVPVETRHRGIYPIRLYRAALALSGEFFLPGPPSQEDAISRRWTNASVVVATGDARGLRTVSPLTWGADALQFRPGATQFALEAPLGPYILARAATLVPFRFSADVLGTRSFHVAPVGDWSTIRLASDWPHPSFTGAFSPDTRDVGAHGFEARWKSTHFATGGRDAWQPRVEHGQVKFAERMAGFALAEPVNLYSLAYRATEYGFLFVLFTFAGLALAEVTAGIRLHPIQYLLVGSALAVFFLLLLALSEHVGFPHAYLAASIACVALLTFYLRHPLQTLSRTAAFGGFFVTLYAALYGLLQSEDHALLAGSLLVFGVLAAGMLATRKVDWSTVAARMRAPATPKAA